MNQSDQYARFTWAVSLIEARPLCTVLEIGCGTGILAEKICSGYSPRLFIGIDKSASMIGKALKRNRQFVNSGNALFLQLDISSDEPDVHLRDATRSLHGDKKANINDTQGLFDYVVAFNVNLFLKNNTKALAAIRQLLKDSGRLCVFYQFPYQVTGKASSPIVMALTNNGFNVLQTEYKELPPTPAVAVIAEVNKS